MVLFSLAGIAIDLVYKASWMLLGSASRLVLGKPKTERKLDELLMRLEEQQQDIQRLEAEIKALK